MNILIVPAIENFDLARKHLRKGTYHTTYFKNIQFVIRDNKPTVLYNNTDCREYDFVWLSSYWGTRDLAYGFQLYLDAFKVKHTTVGQSGSKVVDHMLFALHDISCPNTFFANTRNIETFIDTLEDTCTYPLIIKDIKGYRGKNSFLAQNREELAQIVGHLNPEIKVLYQEYIPNEFDWGVLISNGIVVATEKSYPAEGEFRNNACNGAQELFVDVDTCPKDVRNLAVRAAKTLQLEWCRADIVVNKNTGVAKLLEVNRYPGITKGTDEVKAVINFINDRVKHATVADSYHRNSAPNVNNQEHYS